MNQTEHIKRHLSDLARRNGLNQFVTISFTGTLGRPPLWKDDVTSVHRMVTLYAKLITSEHYGKSRELKRSPELWLPFIGIPEYRTKSKDRTHLHFHILTSFPPISDVKLKFFTRNFWHTRAFKCFGIRPDVKVEPAFDPTGAMRYSLKNLEDGFTIENTIAAGLKF